MDAFFQYMIALIETGESYVFLIPIYVVLLVGERIAHEVMEEVQWDHWDSAANIAITAAFLSVDLVVGKLLPLGLVAAIYEHARLFELGQSAMGWVAAFLLYDLAWYIDHRISHRVGFFWAMHHVHHSSNQYNMTVASRGFVVDKTLLSRPLFYLLPLLGVAPAHFIVILIVTNIWGIAQHTRLIKRLGPLDWLLATPSNHRVHHGADDKYLDKNYGEVLIIWDILFGTYQREHEEPTYGVTERIETYNPLEIEVAGFKWFARKLRRATHWRDWWLCFVMPPGWEPTQATTSDKEVVRDASDGSPSSQGDLTLQSGTLSIDSVEGNLTGTLTNAVFTDEDDPNCTSTIDSVTFDLPIEIR